MHELVLCLLLANSFILLIQGGFPQVTPTEGRPWPLPYSEEPTSGSITIQSGSFDFVSTGNDCDILQNAYLRYQGLIFGSSSSDEFKRFSESSVLSLDVDVQTPCETYPHLNIDESYTLNICPDGDTGSANLTANSVWGALRGLETFSQLVLQTSDPSSFNISCTLIFDYPRFPHRGLMLDTARHYLPLSLIKDNLDVMAMHKFNVFHWHLVDDQSFPYESEYNPTLSQKGSYSSNLIYTANDVSDVIEYARQRGIRVISEFDTPGHVKSWGPGQPGLLTQCYSNGEPDGTVGPVDPSNEDNYAFLEGFFTDISSKFPDHYLHLGGDEVPFECWQSNPNIIDFMTSQGISEDYGALEEYYITRLVEIIKNLPNANGYIVWQEVFDNGVEIDNDTVVHVWKFRGYPDDYYAEMEKVTAAGYQALLSSCWYLNDIEYGTDWQRYYDCDPRGFNDSGDPSQKDLVMGGEACIWGEYVDETNLMSRLWPRASAVAERLWSNQKATTIADAATSRMEEMRCRLVKRGYPAQPINGPSFC